MVKVSISIGVTLPIPGMDYSFIRPEISISDIDPEGDVDAQVALALGAAAVAFDKADEHLEVTIGRLLAVNAGEPTMHERVGEIEDAQRRVHETLLKVRDRLKDHVQGRDDAGHESTEQAAAEGAPVDEAKTEDTE